MKTPIVLISTDGKSKWQFLKEYREAIKRFLVVKKKDEESESAKEFHKRVERLNELSRKNPEPLMRWLRDTEQIPEEGESIDDFIERTNWTLEEDNKWRKINGSPLLKSEEEYRKLFVEKN